MNNSFNNLTTVEFMFSIIGFSGSFILSLEIIPQIYKSYKTKSTKNISFDWLIFYLIGIYLETLLQKKV